MSRSIRPAMPVPTQSLIFSMYRLLGLVILVGMLVGLLVFLGSQLIFSVNQTWMAPTLLSPTDERVLRAHTRLAEHSAARDRLWVEKLELEARRQDAHRVRAAQDEYQRGFRNALDTEVRSGWSEYSRQSRRSQTYLAAAADAKAGGSAIRTDILLPARSGAQRLRLQTLSALRGRLDGKTQSDQTVQRTTESLRLEQEYVKSLLDKARADDIVASLDRSISTLEASIERYDKLLRALNESPYIHAVDGKRTLAFLPYDNILKVRPGDSVYACTFRIFWCRAVGTVGKVLPGELVSEHPYKSDELRGVMVELEMTTTRWAEKRVLFARRPPLLL